MTTQSASRLPAKGEPDFRDTLTHHVAMLNGVGIHYVMGGEGDPVVLLHGWPQTWRSWRRVMLGLADEFTVIAPDLRGLGDSQKPTGSYDITTAADDVVALLEHLGLESARLVGHDLGGLVAYATAALHPDRIRQLVAADAPLPLLGVELPGWAEVERRLWHWSFHAAPDMPETLIAGRERMYMTWFFTGGAYNPAAIPPEDVDDYVRCYSAPGALRASFAYSRSRPQAAARLAKEVGARRLPMPVLALGGALTLGDRVKEAFEQVADNVRGGAIPFCGHWIPDERPEWLTVELRAFFAGASGR
jgi:pimeloyl-ACP methyl ester carboxylesterase